jgi:hypothetical protein
MPKRLAFLILKWGVGREAAFFVMKVNKHLLSISYIFIGSMFRFEEKSRLSIILFYFLYSLSLSPPPCTLSPFSFLDVLSMGAYHVFFSILPYEFCLGLIPLWVLWSAIIYVIK